MKQILRYFFSVSLCFVFASNVLAGELEDKLFDAVWKAEVDVVRALINNSADVNARDSNGDSVLKIADNVELIWAFYCKENLFCSPGVLENTKQIKNMLKAAGAREESL